MSRVTEKFIKFGTAAGEVNSRSLPANFTPANYTPAQIASEGNDKVSAHLSGLDTKVGGLPAPSGGDISETSFAGADNQAAAANVTGFSFANATSRSFVAQVSIVVDATADLYEVMEIRGIQKGSDWEIDTNTTGDDSGVDFTITSVGQIQYTSALYAGFVSLTIKFRALTTSV